ncbi:MAG TPA: hypothetical protein VK071_05505 [Tissierellales bacterium]|nr:hypothetical protein [Tissierellales bacterium]
MKIQKNTIVPLGYGKFVRADKIIALDPIEENRGPGRRTLVYIENINNPITASRTETSILANISKTPKEVLEATAALELLQDILDDIEQIGPMLKRSINEEAGLNLDRIEMKIKEILKNELDHNS